MNLAVSGWLKIIVSIASISVPVASLLLTTAFRNRRRIGTLRCRAG
jgi:hypothetical protein